MKLIEEGFFKRNRKVILIGVLIMLISAIAGAGLGYINAGEDRNLISNALKSDPTIVGEEDEGMSSLYLFTHNLTADLIVMIGGLLFSIISVIIVIFNGISIGGLFGADFTFACTSILPHGIIEYFAGSLALAVAFKITKLEIDVIKNRNIRDTLKDRRVDIKDIAVIIIVTVILLAVAAVIEGHITGMVITWYFGL
ncbi:stage II sporulation protein M [uncultured Methanobrevibacter sp.]|uniref:stage II sporulation protein M n=1 Tax=uncultured Methanobrevibacter sp. TaxID=253161 RepID=UPI00261ABA51|nr:stage II sporulation protein M [uncultured Methanobrevibacter sp.]